MGSVHRCHGRGAYFFRRPFFTVSSGCCVCVCVRSARVWHGTARLFFTLFFKEKNQVFD